MILISALLIMAFIAFIDHSLISHRWGRFTPMLAFLLFIILPLIATAALVMQEQATNNGTETGFMVIYIWLSAVLIAGYQCGKWLFKHKRCQAIPQFMACISVFHVLMLGATYFYLS